MLLNSLTLIYLYNFYIFFDLKYDSKKKGGGEKREKE